MNDKPDALERELAAFAPLPISPDLEHRIAARLAASAQRRRLIRYLSGLAAATFVAGVWLGWHSARPLPERWVNTQPPLARSEEPLPTLQALRRAAAQSPDEFDALLDRRAFGTLESQTAVPTAFTHNLDDYFGH